MRRLGFTVLLCLLVFGVGTAAAAPRPLETGVSYVNPDEPAAIQKTKETGAKLIQSPLRWNLIAPAHQPASWDPSNPADPNYDWGSMDSFVKNAVAAGLTPLLQVRSAPSWANRCGTAATSYDAVCNPDPAALAAFAHAAAVRYSGSFDGLPRVSYWQALNEPNLSLFFQPQYEGSKLVSPAIYRNLLNTFSAAVKGVDPSNLVVAAGLGPIAVPKYTVGPMKFARKLLCMSGGRNPKPVGTECEGGVNFDIFDIHPYTTGAPSHTGGPNDVEMGDLGKLQRLLRAADRAHRINSAYRQTPLWVTEFSYDSKPPDPGGLPMRIERQWIPEALHRAWANGVTHFFWYSLSDNALNPGESWSESLQSGLYFYAPTAAALRPKPAMAAFRFPFMAIRTKHGLKFWGRTPSSRGGKIVIQVWRKGKWRAVHRTRANSVGIFKGAFRTGYGKSKRGSVRVRYGRAYSPGFPMHRVGDFVQPPFG